MVKIAYKSVAQHKVRGLCLQFLPARVLLSKPCRPKAIPSSLTTRLSN
jgi:hypothetical protein